MHHSTLEDMLDEMLEHPNELFISSNSKHCALFSDAEGAFLFLEGDFSGTPEECEAEVRRIMADLEESGQIARIQESDQAKAPDG
jgi:hypothetical protein